MTDKSLLEQAKEAVLREWAEIDTALLEQVREGEALKAYDPNQPRDEFGRWTATGGTPNVTGSSNLELVDSVYSEMREYSEMADVADDLIRQIAIDAIATKEIYDEVSTSEAVEAYGTSSGAIGFYPDGNPYIGDWKLKLGSDLQSEVLSSTLPRDELLYRGVYGSHANDLRSFSVGDTWNSGTRFTNTSRSRVISEIASGWGEDGVLFQILAPKGTSALYVDRNASEFLLPAHTTFRRVEDKDGVLTFEILPRDKS